MLVLVKALEGSAERVVDSVVDSMTARQSRKLFKSWVHHGAVGIRPTANMHSDKYQSR